MLKKGYLATNSIYLSTAHTDKILKIYLKDFEEVIKKLKKIILNKKIKLSGPVCHSEMKRVN